MKYRHLLTLLIAAITATAMTAIAAPAGDGEEEHKVRIKMIKDSTLDLDLELENMEVGESRQHFTEDGKEVVITREEDGYKINVDDEEINVITEQHVKVMTGGDHKVMVMSTGAGEENVDVLIGEPGEKRTMTFVGEDGEKSKFIVKEGAHSYAFSTGDDDHVWVSADGETHDIGDKKVVFIGKESAADKLLKSGALDDLSDEKRQEILDALKSGEPQIEKTIKVKVKKVEDE